MFTAAADLVVTLTGGDVSVLAGGARSLRLASFSANDVTEETVDASFNNQPAGHVFTLSAADEWQKYWIDLPQVVEERTTDGEGNIVLKTIVYSYYFEETDCYPKNYTAVFQNSIGTIGNTLTSDAAVAVENKLNTIDLTDIKTWNIEGDVIPADPILKLTRTVSATTGEGQDAVTTTSDPEVLTEEKEGHTVYRQPEWSGEGKARTYLYEDLPEQDRDGNVYHYDVAEVRFTIGTGADAVTYTAIKHEDGTYVVTSDKGDAEIFGVTQNGYDLVNEPRKVSIDIRKIDERTRNQAVPTAIPGASFRLLQYNGSTYTAYDEIYGAEEGVEMEDDGSLTFLNLPNGEYKIVETKTPPGYIKMTNNDIYFKIESGVVTRYDQAAGAEDREEIPETVMVEETAVANVAVAISYIREDYATTFIVGNEPGAALPSTGGPGTNLIYLFGIMLLGLAGTGLVMKRQKRKRIVGYPTLLS